jgi:hypothetical protein
MLDRLEECFLPLAGGGGNRYDRLSFQERALDQFLDIIERQGLHLLVDQVFLRQGDEARPNAEKSADLEVFHGLGHDPLVGGHHEKDQVDTGRSGDHVVDEFLVARHIDDAQAQPGGQGQRGEAQFDRDASLLLLFQSVRVDPGEGPHEGGLAVIDMSRGAEDDVLFHRWMVLPHRWPVA